MNPAEVRPEAYQAQLATKRMALQQRLADFTPPPVEVFASPPSHYRMRAEFRVWHQGEDLFYVMFEPGPRGRPQRLDACPMVARPIEDSMFVLLERIRGNAMLRHKLFQIDFLATTTGELLATLIYHRPIDAEWDVAARELGRELGIRLMGRSRRNRRVLDRDWVEECLQVEGRSYRYQQVENAFTQPNAVVNAQMLAWASQVAAAAGGDLLELYCGNGNFTLPLARCFRQVLATEVAKRSVHSARENLIANGIDNVTLVRLASEELTQALRGERVFRRLHGVELDDFAFSTVLVDPPRAGLDSATLQLVAGFERILYISCNPETLAANLESLDASHRLERLALFDQFPYTNHMEAGAWLVRR